LLLTGVAGCYWETGDSPGRPVEEPKLESEKGGDEAPESGFEATLKTAEQGDAIAQFNLGVMYRDAEGVPEDDAEAVKWFRKAAEQGDADAQYNLGYMYGDGTIVPQSSTEMEKWWRKAAEQGDADAQATLGRMYRKGEGVPEAVKWYRKAAGQGNADAQAKLGGMHENGKGVPENDAEDAPYRGEWQSCRSSHVDRH